MVELVPAFVTVALGRKMSGVESRVVGRSYGRDRTGENGGPDALGMVGREDGGEQATKRKADQDRLLDIEGIHYREGVGQVMVERVGGDIVLAVGLAVASAVIGDAAEALAEIGELRLVDSRVNDAPGRDEQHGVRGVAIDFVGEIHAVAGNQAVTVRHFCAHGFTFSLTTILPPSG